MATITHAQRIQRIADALIKDTEEILDENTLLPAGSSQETKALALAVARQLAILESIVQRINTGGDSR